MKKEKENPYFREVPKLNEEQLEKIMNMRKMLNLEESQFTGI